MFWALNETKRASCASYQNNKINEISSNKRLCVRDYQWKLSHELREKLKYEVKSTVLLVECSPILYCLHQILKKHTNISLPNTKPLLLQEWKRNEISAYLPLFRDDSVSVWPPQPIGGDTNSKHTHNTNQQTNKKLSSLMTMPKSSTCSIFFSKQKRVFLCFLIFSLKLTFKICKNERKSFKTLKSKTKSKSILTEWFV